MKTQKYLYILSIVLFALSSCEKVIDIDLNDAAPKIVVEAQITNMKGFNLVSISKTGSYYSYDDTERIVGAIVEVSDIMDNKFILNEVAPGMYNNEDLVLDSNSEYKLHIDTGTETFESFSKSPSSVKIDSIKIERSEFSPKNKGDNSSEEPQYKVIAYFLDNANETNFYRLRLSVNGEYLYGFYVVDDRVFNGKTIPYKFNNIFLNDNDQVSVELLGIDEANYNYFYTLRKLLGNGKDITPGNPPTNIKGNAIGIFGASTFDIMKKVYKVKE